MSCTEDGYGSVLPERKSSAIDTMPCDAMYSWRSLSDRRSLRHQAPPWHSTSAGNGPAPRGVWTRASSGASPWRRYSTSATSNSVVFASRTAVVMAGILLGSGEGRAAGSAAKSPGRGDLYEPHALGLIAVEGSIRRDRDDRQADCRSRNARRAVRLMANRNGAGSGPGRTDRGVCNLPPEVWTRRPMHRAGAEGALSGDERRGLSEAEVRHRAARLRGSEGAPGVPGRPVGLLIRTATHRH